MCPEKIVEENVHENVFAKMIWEDHAQNHGQRKKDLRKKHNSYLWFSRKRIREMTHNMAASIVAPMNEPKQENVINL